MIYVRDNMNCPYKQRTKSNLVDRLIMLSLALALLVGLFYIGFSSGWDYGMQESNNALFNSTIEHLNRLSIYFDLAEKEGVI